MFCCFLVVVGLGWLCVCLYVVFGCLVVFLVSLSCVLLCLLVSDVFGTSLYAQMAML